MLELLNYRARPVSNYFYSKVFFKSFNGNLYLILAKRTLFPQNVSPTVRVAVLSIHKCKGILRKNKEYQNVTIIIENKQNNSFVSREKTFAFR